MWLATCLTMKNKKQNKPKTVYKEDTGETIYSMAGLEGKTPEELDRLAEEKKKRVAVTRKERRAMIRAAFEVYGPKFLIIIMSFSLVAVLLYLWLS